jgi:hypothetical protein
MKMENRLIDSGLSLSTGGVGIAIYSPESIGFNEGDDFFSKEFSTPETLSDVKFSKCDCIETVN